MGEHDRLVGDRRCWPCTVMNLGIAAVIAAVPLVAALIRGDTVLLAVAAGWAVLVLAAGIYRVVIRGYLPGAATVAKRTGLHGRIGPGRHDDEAPEPVREGPDDP